MSETQLAPRSTLEHARADGTQERRIEVALRPEEDAALRALAKTVGLRVGDYVRTLIRKEARRFGHLPPGNGPYYVPRETSEPGAGGRLQDPRRATPATNGGAK